MTERHHCGRKISPPLDPVTPLGVFSVGGGAMKCRVQWVNSFRCPGKHAAPLLHGKGCFTPSFATVHLLQHCVLKKKHEVEHQRAFKSV